MNDEGKKISVDGMLVDLCDDAWDVERECGEGGGEKYGIAGAKSQCL